MQCWLINWTLEDFLVYRWRSYQIGVINNFNFLGTLASVIKKEKIVTRKYSLPNILLEGMVKWDTLYI